MKTLKDMLNRELGGGFDTMEGCDCVSRFGESGDGVASVEIEKSCCSDGYTIALELGWYEQRGDADDRAGVVRVIRSMEDALLAFNESMDKP